MSFPPIINIAVEGRWASISGNMLIAFVAVLYELESLQTARRNYFGTTLTYLRAADDALYPSEAEAPTTINRAGLR